MNSWFRGRTRPTTWSEAPTATRGCASSSPGSACDRTGSRLWSTDRLLCPHLRPSQPWFAGSGDSIYEKRAEAKQDGERAVCSVAHLARRRLDVGNRMSPPWPARVRYLNGTCYVASGRLRLAARLALAVHIVSQLWWVSMGRIISRHEIAVAGQSLRETGSELN
jgi:hypothetical protein